MMSLCYMREEAKSQETVGIKTKKLKNKKNKFVFNMTGHEFRSANLEFLCIFEFLRP